MKKFFRKYFYIILIIPVFIGLQGCSDIASLMNGGVTIEEDLSQAVELENQDSALDKLKKEQEEKEMFSNGDEITLSSETTSVDIDSEGRATPFVPYRERNLKYSAMTIGDLPLPPASGEVDENVSNLITAKVTGILYEANSPTAIINVLDDDYLVKVGDKVESFQISSITKDYVAIKTGSNVYRAKVGDIVDGELYGTGVYNLGHRFAGRKHPARKEDVLIVQTKNKKEAANSSSSNNNSSSSGGQNTNTSITDYSLPPVPTLSGILPKVKLKTQAGDIPLSNVIPPKQDTN